MFDEITVATPLPKPKKPRELKGFNFNSLTFQTKSRELILDIYKISRNKKLWRDHLSYDDTIPPESKSRKWIREKYTGVIEFYHFFLCDDFENDYNIEYAATFVDGDMTSLKLIKFRSETNDLRKERDAKWKADMLDREMSAARPINKFFMYPIKRGIRSFLRKASSFLSSAASKLLRLEIKL